MTATLFDSENSAGVFTFFLPRKQRIVVSCHILLAQRWFSSRGELIGKQNRNYGLWASRMTTIMVTFCILLLAEVQLVAQGSLQSSKSSVSRRVWTNSIIDDQGGGRIYLGLRSAVRATTDPLLEPILQFLIRTSLDQISIETGSRAQIWVQGLCFCQQRVNKEIDHEIAPNPHTRVTALWSIVRQSTDMMYSTNEGERQLPSRYQTIYINEILRASTDHHGISRSSYLRIEWLHRTKF